MNTPLQTYYAAGRTIKLARVAGFCFGVRRAVDIALEARAKDNGNLTLLGPLVHNRGVMNDLDSKGIRAAKSLDQVEPGAVVLSAHGVAPSVRLSARQHGLKVVDATCPFVTKVHRAAKRLLEEGYQVLLLGDPGHTEVRGIAGAVDGNITVVGTVEELKKTKLSKKVGIISQTTQRAEDYTQVVAEVARRVPDVRAINTICGATDDLQAAARELAGEVEVVIVIGGRNSANTARLRQSCEEEGIPAYHIETADEVEEAWLAGKSVIGVTGGASTPDEAINEVIDRLGGKSVRAA
jgi:4-hydroxy-3-methylbut-2-enyl diphosphate reductase